MDTMTEVLNELTEHLAKAGAGHLIPAQTDELEDARTFGFPQILLDFYSQAAPDSAMGCIELDQRIWSVQKAISENQDYVPGAYLYPLGYVVFASNLFGDSYCLDTTDKFKNFPVVLFPHDAIEENATLESLEKYRLQVADDLQDFLRQFTSRSLVQTPRYK